MRLIRKSSEKKGIKQELRAHMALMTRSEEPRANMALALAKL